MAYFCCLLLAGAGLFMILKPAFYWELFEGWKSNGGKPSSEYLDNIRIKGYMSAGFALLLMLILLLS